jgi:ataxin-10
MILSRPSGISWLSRLLDKLEVFHEASDGRFELATQIFTTFINFNLHPRLFGALASANEAISPSQTSFLKVLDAHLHLGSDMDLDQNNFMIPVFHLLSVYCVLAIRSGSDDPRLPKVFEGLHLVCEILCATGLAVQARKDDAESREVEEDNVPGKAVVQELKNGVGEQKGVISPTIGE